MKVLLTRSAANNAATAKRLRRHGFIPVSLPLSRIADTGAPIGAGPFDAIIVTSAAAGHILAGRAAHPLDPATPVFTVGERSAAAMRAAGFSSVTPSGGAAAALAGSLIDRFAGEAARVCYLAGKERAFDVHSALKETRIRLDLVELYSVERLDPGRPALENALQAAAGGAQLHYSPASVRAFFALVGRYGLDPLVQSIEMVAISEPTARAAPFSFTGKRHIARSPDEDAMIALLEQTR